MPTKFTDRTQAITEAAYAMARKHGLSEFTRDQVAAHMGMSTGYVSTYFDSDGLRMAVLRRSIELRDWKMMANLLVPPYKDRVKIPRALRAELAHRLAR